ncbi:hypothetical protein P0O24_10510 [Methanotrichaceae archaeon M04Ac]|uniref:Uncharacterized protein n=1 Tax=Candidatus Methanocrinis alkalitolerans TaxID=3033395 RepID=A0ABT5XHN9_9EURY|nr:hypothetical protein [Candidatus Methanocrinis alkalitolerans]MDF0594012.1 hypothetical protein [Candidatus Methanocrinis alkalitolerans]
MISGFIKRPHSRPRALPAFLLPSLDPGVRPPGGAKARQLLPQAAAVGLGGGEGDAADQADSH